MKEAGESKVLRLRKGGGLTRILILGLIVKTLSRSCPGPVRLLRSKDNTIWFVMLCLPHIHPDAEG